MQQRTIPLTEAKDQLEYLVMDVADGNDALTFTIDETPICTLIPYAYYEALQEIINELQHDEETQKDICEWRVYKLLFPELIALPGTATQEVPPHKDMLTDA